MKENDWVCESGSTRNQWVKNDMKPDKCSKYLRTNRMVEEMIIAMSRKR